jgi:ABC-2 type transport system ATP-binding protein
MHRGRIRALGTPEQLKADLSGELEAPTLEDVFRHHAGQGLRGDSSADSSDGEDFRDVRRTRRTATRVG